MQFIHCVRNTAGTGCFHFSDAAVAPADTDSGNAVGGGANHVLDGITNHNGFQIGAGLLQQVGNDISFVIPASI